jgi:hypothetical protein
MSSIAVAEESGRGEQQMELSIVALLRRVRERTMADGRRAYVRVRADSLPEHARYRDDGCEVNESCLTCPLPRCRYDEPGGLRGLVNSYRDGQMTEMRDKGVPVETIAERFGVSRRTVFRILGSSGNQRADARPSGRREARCA